MLSIDISHAASFLPLPYQAALRPRLERAANWLQQGGGKGSDFIGWVTLPRDYDREEYARILAAAKTIQADSKALVVIGIGGSYLGARGVIECLCSPNYNLKKKSTPNIYFIGNGLSSDALAEVMELIGDDDFSVNVISKSGTTTEPAVAFRFFREKLEQKYGKEGAAKRIYATTDAHKGALKSLADQEGYETFIVPDNIGGRYSVLTAVGLLPIAVAGVDLAELMGGAQEMMALCARSDYSNPAWQYAAMRHELYRQGKKVELLACFEPAFRFMAEWWKQLYGESEGVGVTLFLLFFHLKKRGFKWYEYVLYYLAMPLAAGTLQGIRGGDLTLIASQIAVFFSYPVILYQANSIPIMNAVGTENFFWGEEYYTGLVKFIPRFLWPDKPLSFDYKLKELANYDFEGGEFIRLYVMIYI